MDRPNQPVFPLRVIFGDGDVWVFNDQFELECSLEWFDSTDPEENAVVTDKFDRPVRLKVVKLELVVLELD